MGTGRSIQALRSFVLYSRFYSDDTHRLTFSLTRDSQVPFGALRLGPDTANSISDLSKCRRRQHYFESVSMALTLHTSPFSDRHQAGDTFRVITTKTQVYALSLTLTWLGRV